MFTAYAARCRDCMLQICSLFSRRWCVSRLYSTEWDEGPQPYYQVSYIPVNTAAQQRCACERCLDLSAMQVLTLDYQQYMSRIQIVVTCLAI